MPDLARANLERYFAVTTWENLLFMTGRVTSFERTPAPGIMALFALGGIALTGALRRERTRQ